MALFKLIEVSTKTKLDTMPITPGQYYILDDGAMYYDNTLNSRVVLSPDLSNFLQKNFTTSLVKGVEYAVTEDKQLKITVTSINPVDNSESTVENVFSSPTDTIAFTTTADGALQIDVVTADAIEAGVALPVSSDLVHTALENINKEIARVETKTTATIKVIPVTTDANTALGTWKTLTGVDPKADDIAILTQAIGESNKTSYTGYVYDGSNWQAMDGNYDASNVYLGTDILLAGNYTTVGNVKKDTTSATKDAGWTGKSLADILTSIFTETLNPGKPTPSVSMSLTNAGAVEVGTTITPSFKVTFDPKTYSYGSAKDNGKAGGSTYAAPTDVEVTTSAGEKLEGTMTTGESWNGGKVELTLTGEAIKVTTSTSYNATKVTCDYGDGVIPWTNTKSEYAASQVKGTTATSNSATSKITGYYAKYWGYTTADNLIADPANLSASDITTKLTKVQTIPTSTKNNAMRQIFFVVPKGTVSKVDVIASTTIPFGTAAKGASVNLTDASGVDTYECDVWYISQPLPGADNETYSIALS